MQQSNRKAYVFPSLQKLYIMQLKGKNPLFFSLFYIRFYFSAIISYI